MCGDNTNNENERGNNINELELKLNLENLTESEMETLTNLCEKANKPKSKVWRPKNGEVYWNSYVDGDIDSHIWDEDRYDECCFKIGNCFKTKEEAEFYKAKLKIQIELERFALENNEKEIDWSNFNQDKYIICYNHECSRLCACWCDFGQNLGVVYFTSKEIAEQAIKEMGKVRIEKYLFGIK